MRIIRITSVCDKPGIKKSHLYAEIAGGRFPKPVPWVPKPVAGSSRKSISR